MRKATIYSYVTEHASETHRKYKLLRKDDGRCHVEVADGNEDRLTYEEIINILSKETEGGYHLWTFEEYWITDSRGDV